MFAPGGPRKRVRPYKDQISLSNFFASLFLSLSQEGEEVDSHRVQKVQIVPLNINP